MIRRILAACAVAAYLVVAAPPESSASAPPVRSDCSAEVSTQLQAWLNALPDGSTVDFGDGCYLVEQTLRIVGKHDLTFNGGTFRARTTGAQLAPWDGKTASWPRHRHHLGIASSSGITFNGTRIEGPNSGYLYDSTLEAQHGFSVTGSSDVQIIDVSVSNVWGDFVTISGRSTFVTVTRLTGSGAGRQGVAITDASDITVRDSRFDRVRRSCVDIEPQAVIGEQVRRVNILHNTFVECGNTTVGAGGSGYKADLTVVGNTSTQPWWSKIGTGNGRLVITDNTSQGTPTTRPLLTVGTGWTSADYSRNQFPVKPLTCIKGVCTGGYWLVVTAPVATVIDGIRVT